MKRILYMSTKPKISTNKLDNSKISYHARQQIMSSILACLLLPLVTGYTAWQLPSLSQHHSYLTKRLTISPTQRNMNRSPSLWTPNLYVPESLGTWHVTRVSLRYSTLSRTSLNLRGKRAHSTVSGHPTLMSFPRINGYSLQHVIYPLKLSLRKSTSSPRNMSLSNNYHCECISLPLDTQLIFLPCHWILILPWSVSLTLRYKKHHLQNINGFNNLWTPFYALTMSSFPRMALIYEAVLLKYSQNGFILTLLI